MTKAQLLVIMQKQLRNLSNYIVAEDREAAINASLRETGWELPVSGSFKEHWLVERTKRHLFDFLRSGSAHKFKVEGINLQQRFEHYNILIKNMDELYQAARIENPAEFAGVDTFKMFGTKVDAGFKYDDIGKDITYDEDTSVAFTPTQDD